MNNKNSLFEWRNAILSSDLHPTMRLVLMVISTHMNQNGGSAFPSQKTIAKEAGICVRMVKYHLKAAANTGWVKRSLYPNPSGQGWRRTHYGISIPEGGATKVKVVQPIAPRNGEGGAIQDTTWCNPLHTNSSMNSSTGEEKSSSHRVLRAPSPQEGVVGDTYIEIVTTESNPTPHQVPVSPKPTPWIRPTMVWAQEEFDRTKDYKAYLENINLAKAYERMGAS